MTHATPGPWAYDPQDCEVYTMDDHGGGGRIGTGRIACLDTDCIDIEQIEADGRLIAAAPELLETLEWLRQDLLGEQGDPAAYGMEITNPEHPYHETLARMDAVIAKAKGTDR